MLSDLRRKKIKLYNRKINTSGIKRNSTGKLQKKRKRIIENGKSKLFPL